MYNFFEYSKKNMNGLYGMDLIIDTLEKAYNKEDKTEWNMLEKTNDMIVSKLIKIKHNENIEEQKCELLKFTLELMNGTIK